MPVVPIQDLKALLAPGARLAGLDVGTKTIGIAVSDVSRRIATARETVRRGKFQADAQRLKRLTETEGIGGFIVGLPVSMDGTEGPRCQSIRQFAANLVAVIDLPTAFWDERLSTAAVERVLIDGADASRKRRGEVVDKMAAGWILQGFLDAG